MRAVLDVTRIGLAAESYVDPLEAQGASARSGHFPIAHPVLPPDVLHMRLVQHHAFGIGNARHAAYLVSERHRRCARCRTPLRHKPDLDGLEAVSEPCRTRLGTVLGPVHPADVLRVHAVVHVVVHGHLTGQAYLDGLEPQGAPRRAAHGAVLRVRLLPADVLDMRSVLDVTRVRMICKPDVNALEAQRLARSAACRAIPPPRGFPPHILDVRSVFDHMRFLRIGLHDGERIGLSALVVAFALRGHGVGATVHPPILIRHVEVGRGEHLVKLAVLRPVHGD